MPTVVDGIRFPSKAEAARYGRLKGLEAAGAITGLRLQPRWFFPINGCDLRIGNRRVRYTADFAYREVATGCEIVEDVKGVLTRDASLRLALMHAVHGIAVKVVGRR